MSFPSVTKLAQSMGLSLEQLQPADADQLLLAAVKSDCPEAVAFLHQKSHEARDNPDGVIWTEDPNSQLGRQLIRIHASDAVRRLVSLHVCHGMRLSFANCCGGKVGGKVDKDGEDSVFQVRCQAGPVAYADC